MERFLIIEMREVRNQDEFGLLLFDDLADGFNPSFNL